MAVESASYISQLDQTNPNGSAIKAEGDNHIRLVKTVLQTSFPAISGAVTVSHTDLNNITTTQPVSETSTKPATTAFVKNAIANATGINFPGQAGNAGKFLGTDGTTPTWTAITALGTPIASAATVNLDDATGDLVHITGTTTITAITLASGAERTVVFDGALTLTHNVTTLILPGGANIATAAGDRATLRGDGTGNVRCIHYTKASGVAVVSSPSVMTYIGTITASSSATVDVALSGPYKAFKILAVGVTATTASALLLKYTTNNFTSVANFGTSSLCGFPGASPSGNLNQSHVFRPSGAQAFSGEITLLDPLNSHTSANAFANFQAMFHGVDGASAAFSTVVSSGVSGTATINGVRFVPDTGTITTGTFLIYGVS